MSGQRRWIKVWARTVGMPVGVTDEDKPEFLPIKQSDVTKALAFRTFWIVLHVVTCLMIVAGNGRSLGWWQLSKLNFILAFRIAQPKSEIFIHIINYGLLTYKMYKVSP